MRSRGFTLIEILIAVFLIASLVALYGAALHSTTLTKNARYEGIAMRIAQGKLDDLRAGSYAALPESGEFSDTQLGMLPASGATMTVADYNSKTKRVTVTVSWQAQNSPARDYSLTTLITEIGGI